MNDQNRINDQNRVDNKQSKSSENRRQEIHLYDKSRLTLNGVEDVSFYDETGIRLQSNFGSISIDGKDLHITRLSVETGELDIEGDIGGILYFDSQPKPAKRKLFGRN